MLGRPTGTWEQAGAIALAAAGQEAALSRASAARPWKLDGFTVSPKEPPWNRPMSVNIPRGDVLRGVLARRPAGVAATESWLETGLLRRYRDLAAASGERAAG